MSDKKIVIDTEVLRKIIEYDREFEKELFQIFIENADFNIKKLEIASKTNDNNLWYMAAHARVEGDKWNNGSYFVNLNRLNL